MKKLVLSLVVLISCANLFAQKYEGSVNLSVTAIGGSIAVSNGYNFSKDYIGLGLECGAWSLVFINQEWTSAYIDYRHDFIVAQKGANKGSIYVHAAPGIAHAGFFSFAPIPVPDGKGGATVANATTQGWSWYAKFGFGYNWHFRKCGIGLGLQGTMMNYQNDTPLCMPMLQFNFRW